MTSILRIAPAGDALPAAEMVGSKAANLAEMARLGLPVPPAFALPIDLCRGIIAGEESAARALRDGLREGIAFLETATGRRFGDRSAPLLVSVRSGAARSMPGMLDTILDIGCSRVAAQGLVRMTGNPRFAWDCRRRLLQSYGETVLGLEPGLFERACAELMHGEGAERIEELDSEALERLASSYDGLIEEAGGVLGEDPMQQLEEAARAVYRSWNSPRATTYRALQHLDGLAGTAVTVQAMVFGNSGFGSAAGVAFSRDPSSGAPVRIVELLFEAQGEDVVSGRRTPEQGEILARRLPEVASALDQALARLERHFADAQDVEFTIESGRLWLLQTRAAKRTSRAALRIALDLARDGVIAREEALRRLADLDTAALAVRRFAAAPHPDALGLGAAPGVAIGRAAFDPAAVERLAAAGEPVVLVRPEIGTADIAGFERAAGLVTAAGGRTAHAALVARQMGLPCVVGCAGLAVEPAAGRGALGDRRIAQGDWLSLDGDSGAVYLQRLEVVTSRPEAELAELARWREAGQRV